MKVYKAIAQAATARLNCEDSGNTYWEGVWRDKVRWIEENYLPSGSGFDSGTTFNWNAYRDHPERIEFTTAFHHMDMNGGYDGWTNHQVVVRADLGWDFQVLVKGKDRNEIKQYIKEMFEGALDREVENCPHDVASLV